MLKKRFQNEKKLIICTTIIQTKNIVNHMHIYKEILFKFYYKMQS